MFKICSLTIFLRPVYFVPTKCKVIYHIYVSLYKLFFVSNKHCQSGREVVYFTYQFAVERTLRH